MTLSRFIDTQVVKLPFCANFQFEENKHAPICDIRIEYYFIKKQANSLETYRKDHQGNQ